MGEARLNGLALMYIHRDIECDIESVVDELKPPVANLNNHLMKVHVVTSPALRMALLAEACLNASSSITLKKDEQKKQKKTSLPSQSFLREHTTSHNIIIHICICYFVGLVAYLFIYFVLFCPIMS